LLCPVAFHSRAVGLTGAASIRASPAGERFSYRLYHFNRSSPHSCTPMSWTAAKSPCKRSPLGTALR